MKLSISRWRTPFVLTGLLLLAGLMAPTALAAPSTATASVTPSPAPALAGATQNYTFSLAPTSGKIGSFNLTTPAGWSIAPLASPPEGITRPTATQIQGRQLNILASSPLSLTFTAQAPCSPANGTWAVAAKSSGGFTGSSFSVNQPTTTLSSESSCTAAFDNGRGPADAAFNGGTKSENITSVPYAPSGAAMRVLVNDAAGQPRGDISITLRLLCAPPDSVCAPTAGGASLTGPVTATSGAAGIATFTGSTGNPIAIDEVGLRYRLNPTGSGIASTASGEFGIYEEGEECANPCSVHGKSADNKIDATVTANTPSGTLSVLVSDVGLDCTDAVPSDYEYAPLSAQVVAWKYTGGGSQTISVLVDKTLVHTQTDRGNDLDFCFLVEGVDPVNGGPKQFVDKFGVTHTATTDADDAPDPGLLPVCTRTITQNCILTETAVQRGDRLVTVTVEDGRGKF